MVRLVLTAGTGRVRLVVRAPTLSGAGRVHQWAAPVRIHHDFLRPLVRSDSGAELPPDLARTRGPLSVV